MRPFFKQVLDTGKVLHQKGTPMKIAFTTGTGGGVDPYVRTTAQYLVEKGHTVHIIYSNKPEWNPGLKNLHIHEVSQPSPFHYYIAKAGLSNTQYPTLVRQRGASANLAKKLKAIREKQGLDIVELTESASDSSLYKEIPYIYKMHGSGWTFRHYCEDRKYYKFQIENERDMILAAQQVHSLSRSLADFIAGACEVPRRLITVTPYPIHIEEFKPAGPPPNGPPYRLMAVGRLEKRKGTHTLVAALQKVWEKEPETHLHLYGSDKDYGKRQIEAAIPPDVHKGRIHFEGFVRRETLIERYQQTHVYVTPTRYETFGYTILEAMACGRPVIASDIGPVPELVRHEDTGWLFPRDNADALAQTILTALKNPEQREQFGKEGRRIAERYNTEAILTQQLTLYEKVLRNA